MDCLFYFDILEETQKIKFSSCGATALVLLIALGLLIPTEPGQI